MKLLNYWHDYIKGKIETLTTDMNTRFGAVGQNITNLQKTCSDLQTNINSVGSGLNTECQKLDKRITDVQNLLQNSKDIAPGALYACIVDVDMEIDSDGEYLWNVPNHDSYTSIIGLLRVRVISVTGEMSPSTIEAELVKVSTTADTTEESGYSIATIKFTNSNAHTFSGKVRCTVLAWDKTKVI